MTAHPSQPSTPIEVSRQGRLAKVLTSSGLHSLILNAGPSLTYLTGLHFHLSERPVAIFFIPGRHPLIVLPELEQEKLKGLPFNLEAFHYGEDPTTWPAIFEQAVKSAGLAGNRNGVEPRQLRLLEYRLLSSEASPTNFVSAEEVVANLRMRKDEHEVVAMRSAARIAEQALTVTLPFIKVGMSERDLAIELTLQLFRAGCDPQVPFSPIVSAGPNSANPHATPTDRKLAPGDLLVIDWGASYQGYFSDITRTFTIGEVQPDYRNICRVVLEANSAGRAAARPGVTASEVDHAARAVIETEGYGKYFTHRTGHGLGMEGHEEPYIRSGNPLQLQPGMAFTIEPGIYLPGRNGVRIEDDVVITDSGSECLTSLPREATQLT
jgi:Xaa-Pro dipeptidase